MANRIHLSLTFFFLVLTVSVMGQMQRNKNELFPRYGNYQSKGWIVNPGFTYMMPPVKEAQDRLWVGSDSVYDVLYDAKGRFGLNLEFGRFMAVERIRVISYIDFTIGGRIFRGEENYVATLDAPDGTDEVKIEDTGTFSETYLTASFNATNTYSLSKEWSMHNTLGFNFDYKFASVYEYNDNGLGMDLQYPGDYRFQWHYKLGFGFKMADNLFVIPSVETPILTIYEYDDLKSTTAIFDSRYRPLIVRVTVMVLDKKKDRKCPTKNPKRHKSENLFGR